MLIQVVTVGDMQHIYYTMAKGDEIPLHVHPKDHFSHLIRGAAWVLDGVYDDLDRLLPRDVRVMKGGVPHGFRADMDDTILCNVTNVADLPNNDARTIWT